MKCLDSFVMEFAYLVYDQSAMAHNATLVQALSDMGSESLGRQGNSAYIPSDTMAVAQAS